MAEAPRARPIEYYNPRPLILGICFFWGIAMGFCLFYFSPPKQMLGPEQSSASQPDAPRTQLTDQERRRIGAPVLEEVAPGPAVAAAVQPQFEAMTIDPPTPPITTEGGLTGRTAHQLTRQNNLRPYSAPQPQRRAPPPVMDAPPIPELLP